MSYRILQSINGEGGIRTPGALARTLVFETSPNTPKTPENTAFPEVPPPVAPPVGGENRPADPDLARLVDAWPDLPPAIRAGILAMIGVACGTAGDGQRKG